MSTKYLNDSGLSYFWSKIKAWCNSLFALDSAVVHKTGNETIAGTKTFSSTIDGNAATATDASRLKSSTPSSTACKVVFTGGALELGTSAGNAYVGSSNNVQLISVPEDGTSISQTTANAQNLRFIWNGNYFSDIFISPNNKYVWHRDVGNTVAYPWRRLVEENAAGITAPNWDISIAGNAATASAIAWSGITSKPTTISGYGITDAKIANGTITLGSDSITPLTSVPSHNQASNTINAMTGYSKPSSASAIGTGDTLNAAIGKLEYKVDAYDDSNYVHKTGDETISGTKTFSGSQSTNRIAIQNSSFAKGTYPSEHTFWALYNCDANGTIWPNNVVGMFETDAYPDGTVATYMRAMKNASGNVENASYVACYYDTVNDIAYAACPTPSFSSDNLAIATTQWVRHASGSTTLYSWGFAERGVLGENYEMSVSDFDGGLAGGAWRVGSFRAGTASAPSDNVGDFTLIRLYDGADQFASFICSSPRTEKLFFGRFWNGAWQGWRDIFTTTYNLVFAGAVANTVKLNRNTDSLYLVGGTSIDNNSFLALAGSQNSGVTAGAFYLHAKTGSNADKTLGGTPGGTLQWNGQNIQTTSDQRLKTKLESVPDEVLDAWEDVEWGQFRYLEAVAEKGGNARLHSGLVSQQVQEAFSGRGLDACAYGLVCHETRDAVDEDVVVGTCPAYTGEDGVFHPEEKTTEHRHEDAVDLWMIRYAEALCMEAAYMRRENARLRKRIAGLEERLAALELKVS